MAPPRSFSAENSSEASPETVAPPGTRVTTSGERPNMTHHLHSIIELQNALDEMRAAEELLNGIPDWMRELHEEHSGRKAEIDLLEASIDELALGRRTFESEVTDYRERVKHYQEQIGQVRNQREYGALLQEIDTANQRIKELEEQSFAALATQDEIQQQLDEERSRFAGLDERYAEGLAKWEKEKPSVAQKAEQLSGRIAVLRERLPKQVLLRYERISGRYNGRALAPILGLERTGKGPMIWHCGACNYRVRPQSVVVIRNEGRIELCDSCKRILYFEEAPA